MKYCKKCGMLLEDTHEHCIRCGADVMVPENVSMYPIEVMETIEEENQRKKASGKIVAMIIGLVVALVGLIIFFLAAASKGSLKIPESSNEATAAAQAPSAEEVTPEESVASPAEEAVEEPEVTPEPTPKASGRKINDDDGAYYDYVEETDDAGNVVFTALLPEDLTERELIKDYEVYSDRYPFTVMFTAATKSNDVRFTYLSPKKLWYKQSDSGKSRSNEADVSHYMTYFKYDGDKSFLEPLLEQSYPGAKFEVKDEYDVNPVTVEKLASFAKARNKEMFNEKGDIAHIGEGTSYANMNFESSAKVYKYEITLPDKNQLFCKYYVPSMALNLAYAAGNSNDKGTVTEWYNFALIGLETGNEDDLDDYEQAFDLFVANALPTNLFMFINESYSKEIKESVQSFDDVVKAQEKELEEEAEEYDEEDEAEAEDTAKTAKDKDKDKTEDKSKDKAEDKSKDKTEDKSKVTADSEPKEVEPLDKAKLEKYGKEYKPSDKLDDFDANVMDILTSVGVCFKGTDVNIYGGKDDKAAFFDSNKKKVFLSPKAKEYPGDQYEELKMQGGSEESADGAAESTADSAGDDTDNGNEDKQQDKKKDKPKGGVE